MLERADVKPIEPRVSWAATAHLGIVDRSRGRQLVVSMFHHGEDEEENEYSDPALILRLHCLTRGYLTQQETWSIDLVGVPRRRQRKRDYKSIPRDVFEFVRAAFTMMSQRPDITISLVYGSRFLKAEKGAS